MAETTIHRGSFANIPSTATPGLLWLKSYIAIIDSLEGDAERISSLVQPEARFIFNGNAIGVTTQVAAALNGRRDKLRVFRHDGTAAWDIVSGDDSTRTVMFESTSTSGFKGDAEGVEARVAEFSVVGLVRDDGDGGWKAVELKTFMDPSPVSPENRGKQS